MSLLDAEVWSGSIFTGQWSTVAGGETAVVEPATGEEIGRIGFAGPDDIARAAARPFEAQRDWARRSYEERAAVLRRAGALWEEHASEVEGWLVRERGPCWPKRRLRLTWPPRNATRRRCPRVRPARSWPPL